MRMNEDGKTVAAMDILVPGVCSPAQNSDHKLHLADFNHPCFYYHQGINCVILLNLIQRLESSSVVLRERRGMCNPTCFSSSRCSTVILFLQPVNMKHSFDRAEVLQSRIEEMGLVPEDYCKTDRICTARHSFLGLRLFIRFEMFAKISYGIK